MSLGLKKSTSCLFIIISFSFFWESKMPEAAFFLLLSYLSPPLLPHKKIKWSWHRCSSSSSSSIYVLESSGHATRGREGTFWKERGDRQFFLLFRKIRSFHWTRMNGRNKDEPNFWEEKGEFFFSLFSKLFFYFSVWTCLTSQTFALSGGGATVKWTLFGCHSSFS